MKRTLILSIALSLVWQMSGFVLADGAKDEKAKSKAAELIAQARSALGGEKLKSLQSLYLSSAYRRVIGDREMSGEVEYEMLLPDKIKRSETLSPMPNMEITRIDVLNGNQIWNDSKSGGMGGGGMVMINRGPAANNPQIQAAIENGVRADLTRIMLTFLLASPTSIPVEYAFAGEAESPDGKADAVDITGANNFNVRLFLDQKTHRPLMFTYRGRQPQMMMRTVMGGPGGNREEAEKRAKEEADRASANMQAPPEVEFQMALDDYRAVDGVQFPHSITRSVDGKVTEELTLKKIKVNAPIKPQTFEKN
jgi:hypothetical protein